MEQPIHYWVPSIAPCDMLFVTSHKYPQWNGDLLVGSLAFQYLERLILEESCSQRKIARWPWKGTQYSTRP